MKTILKIGNEKILLKGDPKTAELSNVIELLRGAKPVSHNHNYNDQRAFERNQKEIEYVSGDVICSDRVTVEIHLLPDGDVLTQQEFEAACESAKQNAKPIKKDVAG